jgi:hypothetical protein
MDADVVTHEPVDDAWLRSLLPSGSYMAWLDRTRTYPECGFMIFDSRHQAHGEFMQRLRSIYQTNHVFDLAETHDSYVTQQIVKECVKDGLMREPASLSGTARSSNHPFPLSELGSRLDHAKGPRKKYGRTPKHEVRRTERHWL